MGEELSKLIEARFIREIKHSDWLANLVMVPKKDKSWRLCIDFKDLNKACPKDPFPLPRIDQIIDATAGHDLLCFLDAYSGYHQIKMKESDQPQRHSLPHMGLSASTLCLSGSKTLVPPTNA